MQVSVEDTSASRALAIERARAALPVAVLSLLLVALALQRGGYYAESWSLPTVGCAWIVVLVGVLGDRQRLRRLELCFLGGLGMLGLLTLVSSAWTPGGLGTALPPTQLLALDVAALAVLLLLFRRGTPLVATLWASLLAVSLLGLGSRIFPTSVAYDPASQNRLYEPLGYWNSLGLWAAMGLCLSLVLGARARSLRLRALAAASTVPFAVTLYFTFSRGAWIALAVGLVVAFAFDPRRLALAAWVAMLAPWPALAVLLASRTYALTTLYPVLGDAQAAGRKLAVELLVLSWVAAGSASVLAAIAQRTTVPVLARRLFAAGLVAMCLLGAAAGTLRFGTPWTIAQHVKQRFDATPPAVPANLNSRLFDANGSFRAEIWRAALEDVSDHPLAGSGAGSFAGEWLQYRRTPVDLTNAHELYLETLAELGPLGLAFLVTALGAPLIAAWRARRHPLAAGATAAYVAFLVHAGLDWDWQLAAVALAGLGCGAALLVLARGNVRSGRTSRRDRTVIAAVGIVLAGFALWSLQGTHALGQARDASDNGDWTAAQAHAKSAVARDGGFSAQPWILLGEAQTALREPQAARASLRVAVQRNSRSWQAWFDLANVSSGVERTQAARTAFQLNPLDPETQALAGVVSVTPPAP